MNPAASNDGTQESLTFTAKDMRSRPCVGISWRSEWQEI